MVCPEGAAAAAWKLTGELTVAPAAGVQMVTEPGPPVAVHCATSHPETETTSKTRNSERQRNACLPKKHELARLQCSSCSTLAFAAFDPGPNVFT